MRKRITEIVKCNIAVNDVQFVLVVDDTCKKFYAKYKREAKSSKVIVKNSQMIVSAEDALKLIFQVENALYVDMQEFMTTNTNLYIADNKKTAKKLLELKEIYKSIFQELEQTEQTEQAEEESFNNYHLMTLNNRDELLQLAKQAKKANDLSTIIALKANCNLHSHSFKEVRKEIEKIYEELKFLNK